MKQLLSALLVLSLFTQSLFAQTTAETITKPKSDTPAEIVPIEDLLPADTLAYVVTSNLAGLQHSFELLDAYKVAQARLPKEDVESDDNPLSMVSRFLSFGITDSRALEGARVGVAVIVPDLPEETETEKIAKAQTPNARPPFGEPLILLFLEGTRLDDAQKAREQLLAFYNENFVGIGKPSEIKQTDYKGKRVDRFKDGSIGLWFGATYVLSQQAAIDRLINVREDRRAERLTDDQDFIRTRMQMMPQTGLFAYMNGKPLNRMLSAITGSLGNRGMGAGTLGVFSSVLLGIDGIQSAALASTFDRDGVVDRLVINLDATKKNFLTTLFSGPKSESKAAPFIPAGTEVLVTHSVDWVKIYEQFFVKFFYGMQASQEIMQQYYAEEEAERKAAIANNQKPPEKNYEELQKRMAAEMTEEKLAKAIKEREARMDQELGFVLRDELAKDLGNEVTVAYGIPKLVMAAVDSEGRKKDDEGWAVFVGIKDRAATQQALIKTFAYFTGGMMNASTSDDEQKNAAPKTEDQLRQEREMRIQNAQSAWAMMPTEVYKKVEIKSVFAAWLGFSDEHLIVADSKETIKQMLDLSDGGRAMASDYNYSRAMGGIGSATTKVFVGPKMFDDLLNNFIASWVANPTTLADNAGSRAPLNVPATIALAIDSDANGLKLEAFSPLGLAGTAALWGFGDDVRNGTNRKENDARYKLRQLAKAEKTYAKGNKKRYVSLETLTKANKDIFNAESLKNEEGNYKFEFKLKPGAKGYEATATPIKYGRQGRLSFFIDESGTLRSADKQGVAATVADNEEQSYDEEALRAVTEPAPEGEKEVIEVPPPRPARRKR
ncbi:MAG: hypothetical protein JNM09_30425 [Blastocatellia bacterium]|nr:hypothetical protein [Blastocatellia bacterium]